MPYVRVHVDVDDILGDMSDEELRKELMNRAIRRGGQSHNRDDYAIPRGAAKDALNSAADILRKQGRNDLAYKLEEIRTDFVNA